MLATVWTKEKGVRYDREVEVLQLGAGLRGRYAIVIDETTGKLEKVKMKKLKIVHRY